MTTVDRVADLDRVAAEQAADIARAASDRPLVQRQPFTPEPTRPATPAGWPAPGRRRLVEPAPIRDPALDQPPVERRCVDGDCAEPLDWDTPVCRSCGANQLQLAARQIADDLAAATDAHGRPLPPIHIDLRSPR